jgi:hypothetical protein
VYVWPFANRRGALVHLHVGPHRITWCCVGGSKSCAIPPKESLLSGFLGDFPITDGFLNKSSRGTRALVIQVAFTTISHFVCLRQTWHPTPLGLLPTFSRLQYAIHQYDSFLKTQLEIRRSVQNIFHLF